MRLQLASLWHTHVKTVTVNGDGFVFRWNWAGSISNLHSLHCILSNYVLHIIASESNVCVLTHSFFPLWLIPLTYISRLEKLYWSYCTLIFPP